MLKPTSFFSPALRAIVPVSGALLLSVGLSAETPEIPAGIDHDPLDGLLREYVDGKGLVDYGGWKDNGEAVAALKEYLEQFAPQPGEAASGDEKIASLINAYNAFTIEFILDNYPTESIRILDNPFDGKRHRIGGEAVSVDDIEHNMLRPMIGWKVHSVVVCAARSCPPLLNRAYRADTWEDQMEERYRTWLAREDLNAYDTGRWRDTVEVSAIFKWYSDDFAGDHSVKAVLRRFGPEEHADFLSGDFRVAFRDYHWGLNDQSDLGKDYSHSILRSLF